MVATPTATPFPACSSRPCPTAIPSLLGYYSQIKDPRSAQGRRHSLPSLLALATAAMLCGVRGYQPVAQWARDHPDELLRDLGFVPGRTPCGATLHTVFKRLDWTQVAEQLHAWAAVVMQALTPGRPPELDALALDGKTLRGSRTQQAEITHMVSVVSHRLGLTLAQEGVATAGEEPTVVEAVLRSVFLEGRVVTVDALHTRHEVAKQIVGSGGDYLMTVKKNQPYLLEDLKALFAPHHAADQDRQSHTTRERGHGRMEERWLLAVSLSPDDRETLGWPGAAQIFVVERKVSRGGTKGRKHSRALVYGITSLPRERAGAEELLRLNRGHWSIENRSHWVKDVVLGEDASQVASGKIARILAALRSTVLNLVRAERAPNVAARLRRIAARPAEGLTLLGLRTEN